MIEKWKIQNNMPCFCNHKLIKTITNKVATVAIALATMQQQQPYIMVGMVTSMSVFHGEPRVSLTVV